MGSIRFHHITHLHLLGLFTFHPLTAFNKQYSKWITTEMGHWRKSVIKNPYFILLTWVNTKYHYLNLGYLIEILYFTYKFYNMWLTTELFFIHYFATENKYVWERASRWYFLHIITVGFILKNKGIPCFTHLSRNQKSVTIVISPQFLKETFFHLFLEI